ncbi:MAG: hypothetical protein ACOY32_08515 [Thermodesulfobacteriota bacterium]
MTTAISNANPPCCQQNISRLAAQDKGLISYQEAAALSREARIELTTAEGDVVTIAASQEYARSGSMERWATPLQRGFNFTATRFSAESLSLSVAGDLNEEELADIAALMEDLAAIAHQFYNGNTDQAMKKAIEIGDMGSVSQLSASFSSRQSWSLSQLTEYHPVPAAENMGQILAENFTEISSRIDEARTDEMKYAEMLHAQWQQIKDFLEGRLTSPPIDQKPFNAGDHRAMPTARRMQEKIREMVDNHPRLAPFSLPLAHQAINRVGAELPFATAPGANNALKEGLLAEFNNWLYEA